MKNWETSVDDVKEVMDRNGFFISNSEASAILDFLDEDKIQTEVLSSNFHDEVEAREVALLAITGQLEDLNYF